MLCPMYIAHKFVNAAYLMFLARSECVAVEFYFSIHLPSAYCLLPWGFQERPSPLVHGKCSIKGKGRPRDAKDALLTICIGSKEEKEEEVEKEKNSTDSTRGPPGMQDVPGGCSSSESKQKGNLSTMG